MPQPNRHNYRQVRLTVTEERGGRITCRVMVKPLAATWNMKDTVWHHSWATNDPTPHWLDLLAQAYRHLGMEALPYD